MVTYVDYLESTGTQYIDTGISPDVNTMVEIKYMFVADSGYGILCGCRNIAGDGESRFYPVALNWHATNERHTLGNDQQYINYSSNRVHDVVFNNVDHVLSVDNTPKATLDTTQFIAPQISMYLFCGRNAGAADWFASARIYSCKIIDTSTGTLLADFIPVIDNNNVACMYDRVTQDYFYNSGTGEFLFGTASPNYVKKSFLSGVAVGRQLKGWATGEGYKDGDIDRSLLQMRVYDAYSDSRYIGPFPTGTSSRVMLYNNGSVFVPDWTQPFHIHTRVRFDAIPSGTDRSFICGTAIANNYYRNPSFELRSNKHFFFGFSETGTSWTNNIFIGGTDNPNDNLPIVADKPYRLDYKWDGENITASVSDGSVRVTKTSGQSVPHYRNTATPFCFGNNALTTQEADNHTVIDLYDTWIKVNGVTVWGAR